MKKIANPQVRVSLSKELWAELSKKATTNGLSKAGYLRALLMNDVIGGSGIGMTRADKTVIEVVNKCETVSKPKQRRVESRPRHKELPKRTVKVADIFKFI